MARRRSLSTVQAALRILAYLAEHPEGVEVKEVARLLGKSLSTAYALLNSLAEEGFAVKTERGYRLGQAGLAPIPGSSSGRSPYLVEALEELYLRTRERCYLALLTPEGVRLKTRGRQGQPHPLGETLPEETHALALGKVLLAYGALPLPPLRPRTPYTLTDPVALEEELSRVRESGLAAEMEEYAPGLSALAAPLLGPGGEVLGALGVVVPSRRFPFAFSRLARALSEVAQVSPHLSPPAPPPLPPPAEASPRVEVVEPPPALKAKANLRDYAEAYRASLEDPEAFFGGFAREFAWEAPWKEVYQGESRRWFAGGRTNAALNALDRHLPERAQQVALLTLDGEGHLEKWTYRELWELSARLAGVLRGLGVGPGDRVALYLPTGLEAALSLLALARLGAVHVALPVGLGPEALRERLVQSQARLLIAADGYYRRGQLFPLKPVVEAALSGLDLPVLWHARGTTEFLERASEGKPVEAVPVEAHHPLFVLYTSGSTGKPKGVVHGHGGYMVGVAWALRYLLDLKPGEVLHTTADLFWVVGHSFGLYAPLFLGGTSLLVEDRPDHPSPSAFYGRLARLGVDILLTSPTVLRTLRRHGEARPTSLRLVGSVGEALAPEVWRWTREHLAWPLDNWWQTELGAPALATPLALPAKPGFVGVPLPGVEARVVDGEGRVLPPGSKGHLVLLRAGPAQMVDLLGGESPWQGGLYWTGDLATWDEEGYFRILGRSEEVIKVGEARLGTAEVEAAALSHPQVAEAAAIGVPGEEGEEIVVFAVPRSKELPEELKPLLAEKLKAHLLRHLGPVPPPRIVFVESLPRTRSGKILRRLLKAELLGMDPGDTSGLEEAYGGGKAS
ncbi:Acetyl-coenzyme A synthetase [Thermus sp. CCB_US3_UF1]|uniref:AMP-binding protein n=1 Tax=Thermus sp. CCB_US3_UF1 TaxID=1111069 RepID=UPI00023898B2|nr:AMP-binding protein [Thermus sp. CCB_US3_UF1]AEV15885.1 Acetyl-coenzyme A synthetase [Thermus sp. CCB_US3_UF1]